MKRRQIFFYGHVQGVGFRYTALGIVRGFDLTGFVRNCRDGSVELVVEGAIAEIDAFLETLRDRMGGLIREEKMTEFPAMGEFFHFSIEH